MHQTAQAEAARKEADRANLMKTRFLAAASHDLRQPMHALRLFSDSLRRRITDPEQHARRGPHLPIGRGDRADVRCTA